MARLDRIVGPDAVLEALRSGRRIVEIYVADGTPAAEGDVPRLARGEGVPVRMVTEAQLAKEAPDGDAAGVVAYVKSDGYADVGDLLAVAEARGEKPLILAVDAVEDADALGGLLRLADLAGAHGVVVPVRSVGVSPAVVKAARGAAERVKVARVPNLPEALGRLHDLGLLVVGVDPDGVPLTGAMLGASMTLVLPPEGHRLSPAVASACDELVAPPFGAESMALPLAVTAGLVLYEKSRRVEAKAPVVPAASKN